MPHGCQYKKGWPFSSRYEAISRQKTDYKVRNVFFIPLSLLWLLSNFGHEMASFKMADSSMADELSARRVVRLLWGHTYRSWISWLSGGTLQHNNTGFITITSPERHGVSNLRKQYHLFNRPCRHTTKKSKLRVAGPLWGGSSRTRWIPLTKSNNSGSVTSSCPKHSKYLIYRNDNVVICLWCNGDVIIPLCVCWIMLKAIKIHYIHTMSRQLIFQWMHYTYTCLYGMVECPENFMRKTHTNTPSMIA